MLNIHSIETFGTHEGPGIRFVIFTQGCNFRCIYCHNPDTQSVQGGRQTTTDDLVAQILKQKEYFGTNGGVTVSGGEPLLQTEGIIELFFALKNENIHRCIDTNGSILNDRVKKLLEMTDLVLLDIKHIDPIWHKKITGHDNKTPLLFASYLEEIKKPFWLRYVLVPGYTDQPEFIEQWAKHFAVFTSLERAEILPYHTLGAYKYEELGIENKLKNTPLPSPESIKTARTIMSGYLKRVTVR